MDETTNAINVTTQKIVQAVNESHLHPSIIKLILANVGAELDKAMAKAQARQERSKTTNGNNNNEGNQC